MLLSTIVWPTETSGGWVQIITVNGTYTCPMVEKEDDFYFKFKNQWHSFMEYCRDDMKAEILSHKQGVFQKRQSISQSEFESICKKVLSKHSDIKKVEFVGLGKARIYYPSHSGKKMNGATFYFGEKGYITHVGWQYNAGSNKGFFIGEEIAKMIHLALFE